MTYTKYVYCSICDRLRLFVWSFRYHCFVCPHCGEATEIFLSGAGERAAKEFDLPLLAKLPMDTEVARTGDGGEPIVHRDPDHPIAREFRELARQVAARSSTVAWKKGEKA